MDKSLLLSLNNFSISTVNQTLFTIQNMDLHSGEIIGICAPTGNGKSTLFNCIAGILDKDSFFTDGTIQKNENAVLSYAFQEPRLIPSVSVLKNVMLPLENLLEKSEAEDTAALWLQKFKLEHKKESRSGLLSGGEGQRAGLARAFAYLQAAMEPQILLLDEPFASQDEENSLLIVDLIKEYAQTGKGGVLVISHDRQILEKLCTNIVQII